jgi:hypothetical protein
MNSILKSLILICILVLSLNQKAGATVTGVVAGIHSPYEYAGSSPKPCLYMLINGAYYGVAKAATNYLSLIHI